MTAERLLVRATLHLRGLRAGEKTWVDPDDPYVAECLEHDLLVPVDQDPS